MTNNKVLKWAIVLFSALSMFTLSSCGDDADEEGGPQGGLPVKSVMLSRETNYGNDWIYYSLSQGKELNGINEENRENNLDWDIAFNRYNVRTNSGLSGKGKGGALDTKMTDINAVTSVPAGEFTVDVMGSITESLNSFPPPSINTPLNMVLCDAIEFAGPPPTYTPNGHVYIVRCADGRYAKIVLEGFYNDEGESGYISFSYAFQPDGSKNL